MKILFAIALVAFVGTTQAQAFWSCHYVYVNGNAVNVCGDDGN